MKTKITIKISDELQAALEASGYTDQLLQKELSCQLAATLYNRNVLSLKQASTLAGMNLWEFIPFLDKQGIPVSDYDEEEIKKELENAGWLTKQNSQQ